MAGPAWGTVTRVSTPEPHVPDRSGLARAATSTVAATTEILLAVFAFVAGLALLLVIPGLQSAIFWLLDASFGRPLLGPEKVRQVHGIVLTPLAVLASALIYGWLGRRLDLGGPPRPAPWQPAGPGATLGQIVLHVALAIAGSYLIALVMHAVGVPVNEQRLVLELTASGDLRSPEVATLALSALVLAPIGEELLFRGQLLRRTWQRGGARAAYLGSALLFAAFHGNLQGFVVYVWLGLVFARVYARTGRLGAAIAVHFGNNALTMAMLLYGERA